MKMVQNIRNIYRKSKFGRISMVAAECNQTHMLLASREMLPHGMCKQGRPSPEVIKKFHAQLS